MLPCHFFHLATKNRHRFEPCCELYNFFYSSTFFKVKKISFPNNDKHFPDIFIDKLDLFRSFHDPLFLSHLLSYSQYQKLNLLLNKTDFVRQLPILVFHDQKDVLLILASKIIF